MTPEPHEIRQMHDYCLHYRARVRGGETPTRVEDELFMVYSRECYADGIALREPHLDELNA